MSNSLPWRQRPTNSESKALITPSSSRERSLDSTQAQQELSQTPAWSVRHLKLPFDLRDRKVKIEGDVLKTLANIFPQTLELADGGPGVYLHFTCEELPKGPWPLTIAGRPITLGDREGNGKGPLFPMSMPGNMSVRICQHNDARVVSLGCRSFRNLADDVTHSFLTLIPDVHVVEFMLDTERRFHVFLGDQVDITALRNWLPGKIAHCWTMYSHEKELYQGQRLDAERVFSTAVAELRLMENTLAQFHQDVGVANKQLAQSDEALSASTNLYGEASDDKVDWGKKVFLNSPNTGIVPGIMLCKSWRLSHSSTSYPMEARLDYVVYDWTYLGQAGLPPTTSLSPEGTSGAVIWDESGRVIGFPQFYVEDGPWKGFYASVSADEVARAKYRLA